MADIGSSTSLDPAVYKTLLESTKAIPWKIDWSTARFAYIGPQIGPLLGWVPDSWQTVQDWADRIHPEDRERVVSFCVAQSQAGVDHEADYRALRRDGGYVWIRDVVHVVRDANQQVEALVGFMFDISERKRNEEKLLGLQAELHDLSFKDGLTGLANRRRFDQLIDIEWSEARRSRMPLSLVMIDIDYFKQYNDRYGHLKGDACLKQVGALLHSVTTRPRDFLARFGGEEFALVLPDATLEVAQLRAGALRDAIHGLEPRHRGRSVGGITASFGIALYPDHAGDPDALLLAADRALYEAKAAGRDRVSVYAAAQA